MKKFIYFIFALVFIGCKSVDKSMEGSNPLYHNLVVFVKDYENKEVYVRWGRTSNPIKVGKYIDSIKIGERITIQENFYPRYSIKYIPK